MQVVFQTIQNIKLYQLQQVEEQQQTLHKSALLVMMLVRYLLRLVLELEQVDQVVLLVRHRAEDGDLLAVIEPGEVAAVGSLVRVEPGLVQKSAKHPIPSDEDAIGTIPGPLERIQGCYFELSSRDVCDSIV